MKKSHFFKIGAFAVVACMLASCIDEKYDMDNVDMTIGTQGDLTLPTSSTGEIVLKSIMDLDEDAVVQTVDGEFFLKTDGSADVPEVDITPITISKPEIDDIDITVLGKEIFSARSTVMAEGAGGGSTLDEIWASIPSMAYSYTLKKNEAYYTLGKSISSNVPKEVVEIDSVVFADETTLEVTIKVNVGEATDILDRVHLDNLKLNIPYGLHISKAEFIHYTELKQNGGRPVTVQGEIDNTTGVVVLTKEDADAAIIATGHDIKARITYDKAVTGEGSAFIFNKQDMKVSLTGDFFVNGSFRIESADFNKQAVMANAELWDKIIADRNFRVLFPEKVKFLGGASFENDINIHAFAGDVKVKVGDISPIAMNDMPDFLNDPEVCLDLVNPAFFVKVKMNQPLPDDARTGISLTSMYKNGKQVKKSTGEIVIPGDKTEVLFCVADHMEGIKVPEEYSALAVEMVHIKVDSLNGLLMELPDEIKVDVEDIAMDIETMPIPYSNKIKVDYMVYTPLEFGPSFKLVYQGTEEGLADDMDDIDELDAKGIRIEAMAVTNFPLDLTLSLDVQDRRGNSLKGELVQVSDIVIQGHNGTAETSSHPVMLELKPAEGHTISEALKRMDKFHYKATATASGEGKLYENAFIKLTGIKLTLLGGISYDAN